MTERRFASYFLKLPSSLLERQIASLVSRSSDQLPRRSEAGEFSCPNQFSIPYSLIKSPHYDQRIPCNLLHEQSGASHPHQQQNDPARHFARLLLRRQDRRARTQRRGQVHVTAHHRRHRQRLHRRDLASQRLHLRLPRAGTQAR